MICPNCKNENPRAIKACDYCDSRLASTGFRTAPEHEAMAKPTLMKGIEKAGLYRRLWISLVMMVLILPTVACQAGSGVVSNARVAAEVVLATATVSPGQTEEAVQSIEEPTQVPTPPDLPAPAATLDPTTPIAGPTPQIVVNNAVPELVEPTDNVNISQEVYTFVWRWSGAALTDNQSFEVRIWQEGEPHYGAFDARETSKYLEQRDTGSALSFSLSSAYSVRQNGNGEYFWSVAVVQLEPYQLVVESAPRPLLINVSGGGGGGDGGGGRDGGGGGGGHSYE